jgi:hypothetical protein
MRSHARRRGLALTALAAAVVEGTVDCSAVLSS